jgi:oligopeptide/dipeptide ABC transporter ATP-binding protein
MSSPLLEVRDLVVRFGARRLFSMGWQKHSIDAVAGVSFSVQAGETFAIVGESGSGKTTLARAILGLLVPHAGEVRFEDRTVDCLSAAERKIRRREITAIFQDPIGSLSPRFTVRRLLSEPFKIHGFDDRDLDAEVERLLDLVGLSRRLADRLPHQLSGGQARRVGDVSVQGEVLNLLNDLRETLGLSMLIITHNLHVVRHIADRMAIMYLGRLVEQGDTDAIFRSPYHPYALALLSAIPESDPTRRRTRISLDGEVPSLIHRPTGCELHGRCPFVQPLCLAQAPASTTSADGRLYTCHYPLPQP